MKKYVKLSQREHVLTRPGMYIGSLDPDKFITWIYSSGKMVKTEIDYVSGLYKIFDEIIVNVLDHIVRLKMNVGSKRVKEVKVNIKDNGEISVYNDGEGIEIIKDTEYGMYIPELIFGNMLTSTNYDDSEERIIGGQNGIGSKACNIFSKTFYIETVDSKRNKCYKQTFSDNMAHKSEPIIEKYTKYPYTKVVFTPDYEKFKMRSLTDDMKALFVKRIYDLCALTESNVKVYYNEEQLQVKSFEKYVDLYIDNSDYKRFYDCVNENWDIAASYSEQGFSQVSFVNGVNTMKGGKHVDYVVNQLLKKIIELVSKRKKKILKAQHLREHLFVFVKSTIVNPTFDSQTKDSLTTPSSKFGSKLELDPKFIEKIYKSGIVEKAIELISADDDKNAKKTDGKKRNTIRVDKLDDANFAGTTRSQECALILTEGDSAKTMAISGLSEVGRDRYGVFPLKGKVLNVKDTPKDKIWANEEINNLKKILGLETGKTYINTKDLRYGKIILMTDSDVDGCHIKGLIFNLFHSLWPSLLKIDSFMESMITPIVKVTKGSNSKNFYNLSEYDTWRESSNSDTWSIKYYKGLGTSTSKEAKEYFRDMNILTYYHEDETDKCLELAFNKKLADERKQWISEYDKSKIIKFDKETNCRVGFNTYVHNDLIHFSAYDLLRSIPSLCDGFKKSIRKIMFCAFKRKLHKEIKVAQLSGYVSEHGAYHHGETSLQQAIIGMARNYVGSNNINWLLPNGQFGTRLNGGKDHASARYIFTCLNPIDKFIFKEEDFEILTYLEDDGVKIEPEFYMPIIPTVLVNGVIAGIGTGYSTNVPSYNPLEIITYLKQMIKDKELPTLRPWFKGFTGLVHDQTTRGTFKRLSNVKVEITELPVNYWTENFKTYLNNYIDSHPKVLKDFESHYTETDIHFILHFQNKTELDKLLLDQEKFEKEFKLTNTARVDVNNMHLFDRNGRIKKYTISTIMNEFFDIRLEYYQKRKDFLIQKLEKELKYLDARMKFILDVIGGKIKIMNAKKNDIIQYLNANNYIKVDDKYEYLTRMPIFNFTMEKKEELMKEFKDKTSEYNELKSKTIRNMWIQELRELEKELRKDPGFLNGSSLD